MEISLEDAIDFRKYLYEQIEPHMKIIKLLMDCVVIIEEGIAECVIDEKTPLDFLNFNQYQNAVKMYNQTHQTQ